MILGLAPYHYGRWMMYDNAWAWWPGPFTRTHLSADLGAGLCSFFGYAVDSDSALVAAGARSAGFHWDRVTVSIRGMGGMAGDSARPTSTYITAAVSLRCTAARDFEREPGAA